MARQKVADGLPYAERPTQINGVDVVIRQPALSPHPHPSQGGKLVETRGVTQVLLADGRELYECDVCLKTFDNPRSVVAHLTSHNPTKNKPVYDDAILRYVIRLCKQEINAGSHRGYAERVAARLNRDRVATVRGDAWTPAGVSYIHNAYASRFRVKTPARQTINSTSPQKPTSNKTRAEVERMLEKLQAGVGEQRELAVRLERQLTELRAAVSALPRNEVDPAVAEKARNYDVLMAAIIAQQTSPPAKHK